MGGCTFSFTQNELLSYTCINIYLLLFLLILLIVVAVVIVVVAVVIVVVVVVITIFALRQYSVDYAVPK